MAVMELDNSVQAQRKADRIEELMGSDPQFRDSAPLASVVAAKTRPGLSVAEAMATVMEGYADRPALGKRARELVRDPATGRHVLKLLPRFETISYSELWANARAIASEWHHNGANPLRPGDFVCILGFTSPDYATVLLADTHRGAVNVPLQTSAPASQHAAIIAETEPLILATSIDYVDNAVDAVLAGITPPRLVVFDYDERDDDQRDALAAAGARLAQEGRAVVIDTLGDVIVRGRSFVEPPLYKPAEGEDPLGWLFYTSGSTGTPKGAMFTHSLCMNTWTGENPTTAITLSFMPMSHLVGNGYLLMALSNGGTSYCSPKSDLSTLFEDLALVRPTQASLVPRVCEIFYHRYLSEVDARVAAGIDIATAEEEVKRDMRDRMLGGRLVSVGCGSASLAPETYEFMESMLGVHMAIGYSSTEMAGGTVLVDWKVQRNQVIDYKLADVPELGYFSTDKPYPRGELLVKPSRFMGGYYKRPDLTAEKMDADGYYATGDVMAELGPDHLIYVDRRNNVIKLSQGEFVAISRLEALYVHSPAIRQIFIHGTSERAYLVAVIVPDEDLVARLGAQGGQEAVKADLRRALQQVAENERLNGYEVPRDFLIETEPFSLRNGLLSEVGKHQRPKLKDRYGERLEQIYAQLAQDQVDVLRSLRAGGGAMSVLDAVNRATRATLGVGAADVRPDSRFVELGGDSLAALTFSTLLEELFGVEVPVGVIIDPTGSLQRIADYIDAARGTGDGARRPTFASVHGAGATHVEASDLALHKFIDEATLAAAPTLPPPSGEIRTVLLTGATGYLGRFQALAWLERLAATGGKLICIARGANAQEARARIEAALDSDETLLEHFRTLAADHLEVLAGDIGLPGLGLDPASWTRLAETVDLIVHPAAHVNHLLPYNQLFAANVAGTAELIRVAITGRLKRLNVVSTLGVNTVASTLVDEDGDIRVTIPRCAMNDSYANGYGISKWAGEVLLREAFDLCGVPVSVFRPGMILAHSRYAGQLNVPDMFTRLLYSLAVTGLAPGSFYAADTGNGRPRGRYEGFAVDFLADALTAIGARDLPGYHSYNLASTHEDCSSLDDFVDWMIEAGCPIERIDRYDAWLDRFETVLRALPDDQRQQSVLAILDPYRRHQTPGVRMHLPAERFRAAAEATGYQVPAVSKDLIAKYVADLRHLALL